MPGVKVLSNKWPARRLRHSMKVVSAGREKVSSETMKKKPLQRYGATFKGGLGELHLACHIYLVA